MYQQHEKGVKVIAVMRLMHFAGKPLLPQDLTD